MKFKYINTFKNWKHEQYHSGKKKKANVKVYEGKDGFYYFYVNRIEDDFVFNSLWGSHPNENYQHMLNELPSMKFDSVEGALEFVEKWMDENVPELQKVRK